MTGAPVERLAIPLEIAKEKIDPPKPKSRRPNQQLYIGR